MNKEGDKVLIGSELEVFVISKNLNQKGKLQKTRNLIAYSNKRGSENGNKTFSPNDPN